MHSKIKLTIQNGPMAETKFGIDERMNCIIGRDKAYTVCIPRDADEILQVKKMSIKPGIPEPQLGIFIKSENYPKRISNDLLFQLHLFLP